MFGLLRELARSEGITIITCTHDRLVMERADRIEELADGSLVTSEQQDVWHRIQARERSPFAAQSVDSETAMASPASGLSSLIGADSSVFVRDEGAKKPADEAKSEESETGEQDSNLWARPDR